MDDNRLTKRIYFWDKSFAEVLNIQTRSSEVRDVLLTHNLGHIFEPQVNFCPDTVIVKLKESMAIKQNVDLKYRCQEKPKLRTYIQFKDFSCKTSYLTIPMSFISRKHLALVRLSNLSIRIETGRFERPRIEENFRVCQIGCEEDSVENEYHLIFKYTVYNNIRFAWLSKLKTPTNFLNLGTAEKLNVVLNWPESVKCTAQYLIDICNVRSIIIHNKNVNDPELLF